MNPNTRHHILAENLASAFVLNAESPAHSAREFTTTGAVFLLVRTLHQLGEFLPVVRLAAAQLGMPPAELVELLPTEDEAADVRELFDSIGG